MKFLAPLRGKGRVVIPGALPGDLFACSLKASSEIHWKDKAGSVRVEVVSGGTRKELYFIEGGRNDVRYDITELVRKKKRLEIVVEVVEKTCLDKENNTGKRFEAHARFLPSVKDRTRNALEVSGTRLIPAPDADKEWNNAK